MARTPEEVDRLIEFARKSGRPIERPSKPEWEAVDRLRSQVIENKQNTQAFDRLYYLWLEWMEYADELGDYADHLEAENVSLRVALNELEAENKRLVRLNRLLWANPARWIAFRLERSQNGLG